MGGDSPDPKGGTRRLVSLVDEKPDKIYTSKATCIANYFSGANAKDTIDERHTETRSMNSRDTKPRK